MLVAAVLALAPMVLLWGISVRMHNAGIVDIWWAPAFGLVASGMYLSNPTGNIPSVVLVVLTVAWGLRLGGHLALRNIGAAEDYRYASMRRNHGPRFWWVSLFTVFLLQGALVWVISLPLQRALSSGVVRPFGVMDALAVVVFAVGFLFEAVGDWQLRTFRQDPNHHGKVLDLGLWKYTRHPNYFGNAVLWWGLWWLAFNMHGEWWTVLSPVIMTLLLLRVSGVALLEKTIVDRRPGYADYIQRTSAFLPWWPRRRNSDPA